MLESLFYSYRSSGTAFLRTPPAAASEKLEKGKLQHLFQ